ncbi:MAG TPA: substrate-binding domain-containing protein [Candidatus Dormibacteraeota bacterium]|nr:substrate-binding domain-containing protein [Candidatus Dormibacteraeota bacterium]
MKFRKLRSLTLTATAGVFVVVVGACGSSSAATGPTATVPSDLSVSSFNVSFSAMAELKNLHAAGSGLVGVLMPDTTSSTRWVNSDLPYLTKGFQMAGYSASEFKIDNAQGNDATELALAQADITQGAKVLVMAPLDSTVGTQIQALAQSKGVKLISYDRATFTGTNTYYVSFDNVQVGKLIGQGFKDCLSAWNVANPKVFTLNGGEDTDPNAVDFAKGYNSVVWGDSVPQETVGKTANGATLVGDQVAPGWDNSKGQTIFQQQYTAHPEINATIEANDGLANAVVTVLKQNHVPANKIPTTGQDASLGGIENVLTGYQCGTVYKPIYLEAQDAVALATILRAGLTPPAALVNSTTSPAAGKPGSTQPASLLTPYWVDKTKVASTVIADNFVDKATLCQAVTAAVCSANGIS